MPELDTNPGGLFSVATLQALFRFQLTARDQKNSNHGTENGSPAYVTGKFGKAIEFTGVSTKNVSLGNVLNLTGAMSVAAWIKPYSLGNTFVYAKDVSGSRGFCFGINSTEIYSEKGGSALLTSSGAGLAIGQWSFIVQTFDGTTWRQYCNGVLVGSVVTGAVPSSTAVVYLGRRAYVGAEQPFDGLVDDLSVWSVALSATEILTLFTDTTSRLKQYRRTRRPGLIHGL